MTLATLCGAGIGLRAEHYQYIVTEKPATPWFEVLTENYMCDGGLPLYYLDKIRQNYPVTFHGVGMSLASADPLNMQYMKHLKKLMQQFEPAHVSDHLSWVSFDQNYLHDLLPFPYHEESLRHLANKIDQAQEYLNTTLLVENPSSYIGFKQSDIAEYDFINQLVNLTGCKILLDVNNIYVSSFNTGLDANNYISNINKQAIGEIHLAGFEDRGHYYYDTHGDQVNDSVWHLYESLIQLSGHIPSLVEWDNDIPHFKELQIEADKAQTILNRHSTFTENMDEIYEFPATVSK